MNQLIEISAIFNDFSDLFLSGSLIYVSRIMCVSIFIASALYLSILDRSAALDIKKEQGTF